MILVVLQNAWSGAYAGGMWPRESWLLALHRSRSGQRLRIMENAFGAKFEYDNTTPIVGETPDSVVPPDTAHLRRILCLSKPCTCAVQAMHAARVSADALCRGEDGLGELWRCDLRKSPEVVVACGRQAMKAVAPLWSGPLLCVPHPADRLLTNTLYEQAGKMLRLGYVDRGELIQGRGVVKFAELPLAAVEVVR